MTVRVEFPLGEEDHPGLDWRVFEHKEEETP